MKVFAIDRIIGAAMNAIRPATLKPGTNREASQKHKPLIINENAPKLRTFRGRESKDITGLIPELTPPITNPASIAAGKLARLTPGKIMSTTKRLSAVARTVKSEPIMMFCTPDYFI